MVHILAGILSLVHYIKRLNEEPEELRLERCLCCGKLNPWRHGVYPRESDRINSSKESLNPIFIQRYYCPGCHKTCSVLPECIPPRRWYLWETQQTALLLLLLSGSARAVENEVKPSRHTIKRWFSWLVIQFKWHKDTLCNHVPSFGLFTEVIPFWVEIFDKLSLSAAMRLCHHSGLSIP